MFVYEILKAYDDEANRQFYKEKALYDLKYEFKSYAKKFVEEDYKIVLFKKLV